MKYYFSTYTLQGFIRSAVICAAVMLPNILFFLVQKEGDQELAPNTNIIFTWIENCVRGIYMILLFVYAPRKQVRADRRMLYLAIAALLLYFFCWIQYFSHQCRYEYLYRPLAFVPVPMAIFPVIYLVAAAIWMNSIPLAISGCVFGIAHIVNSLDIASQLK